MVVNVTLAATSATVGTVPVFPATIGTLVSETTSAKISKVDNAAGGIHTRYTYEYVNLAGTVQLTGAAASSFVRYAEFPGQRLFAKVKFEVNGEIIAINSVC